MPKTKPEDQKHTVKVDTYLTPSEYEKVSKLCFKTNVPISIFIREAMLRGMK